MRNPVIAALLAISLLVSCGGGRQAAAPDGVSARLVPAVIEAQSAGTEIFQAALPGDGEFNPSRVPAVSSLSQLGSAFLEASTNVTANDQDADFAPASASEYAIWRFAATPEDSIGNVLVELSDASPGANYWIAVADYSTGRWDWLGNASDGNDFEDQLNGSPGQHSSPAGYIYVAVLADTDNPFSVFSVTIEYMQRYDVSGVVLDMQDQPLGMAQVTTNLLDSEQVLAGPGGGFTLHGIPNGSWAVMVALDGYEFFPAVLMITVDNANISDLEFRGNPKTSGFLDNDAYEPNNYFVNAYDIGAGPLADATMSILDDEFDFYSFNIASEGWHYLLFNGDDGILFPRLQLYNDNNVKTNLSSYYVLHGATAVGYYFQRPGKYYVEISCEGGGGGYGLSIADGQPVALGLYLGDSGDPDDGDDGLYEELYNTIVQLEYAEFTSYMISQGTGTIYNNYVAPLPATIRPVDSLYTFSPETVEHDFSTGPLTGLDFNMQASAPVDSMEPNNDFAEATTLTLPLAEPVSGWLGGEQLTDYDNYDFFKFEVQEGKHVMFRARFPDNGPNDFPSSGYFDFYDAAESGVSTKDYSGLHLEERTSNPLSAGTYSLRVFMEGTLMPYQLEIYEYDPLYLSAYYELTGQPLEDSQMLVQSADQDNLDWDSTYTDGIAEIGIPFMPGERVYVHHYRFGMDFEPAYEWVQFADADIQLSPAASLNQDNLEPNDKHDTPAQVSLPIDLQASVSSFTDNNDYYKFSVVSPSSLVVKIMSSVPDAQLRVRFSKASSGTTLYEHVGWGDHIFYYRADDIDDYIVEVTPSSAGEILYNLQVDDAGFDVYSISGTVDNDEPSENYFDSYVVNHTTGDYYETVFSTYLLGYYPIGSYEIQWQIANRNITPAGKTTVVISNADEVLNYTSVYSDKDALEPNDSTGTAALVTLPFSIQASLDTDNDYLAATRDTADYYKYIPAADGLLQVTVTPQENSPVDYDLTLLEGIFSTKLSYGKLSVGGDSKMLRWNVESGKTYYVRVAGGDLRYQIDADIIP